MGKWPYKLARMSAAVPRSLIEESNRMIAMCLRRLFPCLATFCVMCTVCLIGCLLTPQSLANDAVVSSATLSSSSYPKPDVLSEPSNVEISAPPVMSLPRMVYTDIDVPRKTKEFLKNMAASQDELGEPTVQQEAASALAKPTNSQVHEQLKVPAGGIDNLPQIIAAEAETEAYVDDVNDADSNVLEANVVDPYARGKTSPVLTGVAALAEQYGWQQAIRTPVATDPKKCKLGRTMRVAIIQGGPLNEFTVLLRGMLLQLKQDSLLFDDSGAVNSEFDINNTYDFSRMAHSSQSGCIEILADGFYDGQWSDELFRKKSLQLKRRIFETGDVDMVWAMGTVAGSDFADSSLGVPVMVIGSADPVSEGLIDKGEYSNKRNVHVMKETERYSTMLSLFHSMFKFERLGVLIDESPDRQVSQAYPDVLRASRDLNFNVVACSGPLFDEAHIGQVETLKRCLLDLSSKVDAIYLTIGHDRYDGLYELLQPALASQIPVFSQVGEWDVAHGVLLSFADSSWQRAARFEVDVIKQIYNDVPPENISQYISMDYSLALNLDTAKTIGWVPDFTTWSQVDKVFHLTIGKTVQPTVRVRRMSDDLSFGLNYRTLH